MYNSRVMDSAVIKETDQFCTNMSQELSISSAAPSLPPEVFQEFSNTVKVCHLCMGHVATEAGLPKKTMAIIADDFRAEVLKHMEVEAGIQKQFEPERPLGKVSGKNLAQDGNWDNVVILFDAADWRHDDAASPVRKLIQTSLVAHEMAHPALARIRIRSGVASGIPKRSTTPTQIARSWSRIFMDEYFADRIADIIVGRIFSKGEGNVKQSAYLWDVSGADYKTSLQRLFELAYQELPGFVNSYRNYAIALDVMWAKVNSSIEHMLTLLVHARAHADAIESIPLLDSPEIRDLPFVKLYLADTVPALMSVFRASPPILSPTESGERELKVIEAGEAAIRKIWQRLGLTFDESEDPEKFLIHVAAPLQ